jgi:hypothetical protein
MKRERRNPEQIRNGTSWAIPRMFYHEGHQEHEGHEEDMEKGERFG